MHISQIKDSITEFKNFLKDFDFGTGIEEYKKKLLEDKEFEKFLCIGNQYMYVADLVNPKIEFISPGVKDILGYELERFYDNLFFLYEIIHPDDLPLIVKATQKTFKFVYEKKHTKPFENIFSMDYRVKKANGDYIRILRQTGVFINDKEGNIAYSIAVCTDISNIKKISKIEFSMTGPDADLFDFPDEELKQEGNIFTKREKEVLQLIIQGKTSNDIAGLLFISPLTVTSHRNNMMEKTDTKNTAGLIAHVVEKGLDR